MLYCDSLVIGAGPAGLSAAISLAKKGKKVICLEKKGCIGSQIKCAEGIADSLMELLPFKIPSKFLTWQIKGIIFSHSGLTVKKEGPLWSGYSLDRATFEPWLASEAARLGATILTSAELVELKYDGGFVVDSAVVNNKGTIVTIKLKEIIAADGTESTTLKLLGLYSPKQGDIADVYSWEMANLNLRDPKFEQIFFDYYSGGGYAYIFPKNKSVANIGVGGLYPMKKMEEHFYDFINSEGVLNQLNNAKFVSEKSKKVMFRGFVENRILGNVKFVGDSFGDNLKPFVEGILPGIICADLVVNGIDPRERLKTFFGPSDYYADLIEMTYRKHDLSKSSLLVFGAILELISRTEFETLSAMSYTEIRKLISNKLQ